MKEKGNSSPELLVPANGTEIRLDDKMIVMDSLNRSLMDCVEGVDLSLASFPLKLTFESLMIVVSGSLKCRVDFHDMVADTCSCLYISPGTIIEQMEVSPESQIIHLSFLQQTQPSVAVPGKAMLIDLQPQQLTLLKIIYGVLRSILVDETVAAAREQAACRCVELMKAIIDKGDNDDQDKAAAKASRRDDIVARFINEVQKNYRENRDLSFYAERLGLSIKYMSRVVFEQTGRHPSRWIKDYVILDAKAMLRSGQYSVQQVADELHFPNQSFFGKYFKEAVGVSPKKWH